jgi:hypothetical protein
MRMRFGGVGDYNDHVWVLLGGILLIFLVRAAANSDDLSIAIRHGSLLFPGWQRTEGFENLAQTDYSHGAISQMGWWTAILASTARPGAHSNSLRAPNPILP